MLFGLNIIILRNSDFDLIL